MNWMADSQSLFSDSESDSDSETRIRKYLRLVPSQESFSQAETQEPTSTFSQAETQEPSCYEVFVDSQHHLEYSQSQECSSSSEESFSDRTAAENLNNFYHCHNVFKIFVLQLHQNASENWKGPIKCEIQRTEEKQRNPLGLSELTFGDQSEVELTLTDIQSKTQRSEFTQLNLYEQSELTFGDQSEYPSLTEQLSLPETTTENSYQEMLIPSAQQFQPTKNSSSAQTIFTDETRKYGHTFQSYIVSDSENNSFMLGLREMVNKSGACTLDTLKLILEDISTHCKEVSKNRDFGVGFELLSNIRNTMSDRASTEKHFNFLLQQYRETILPEVMDNYNELNVEEKTLCGQMNNFFCGLHLLVAIADVTEAALKQFEKNFLDGKEIGSAVKPELKRYHKSESGTLRLLRTCSKCFARGEDEKNGVYLPWQTYLKGNDEHAKNYILRFKHNRFNMVFLIGQAVYFHRESILDFLSNVHGTTNDLLKAVCLDCKENLYQAGAKSLGLISKFMTAPLWRLIEKPGHILDMNEHYNQLINFLDKCACDAQYTVRFMNGEFKPFEQDYDEEDKVLKELLVSCDHIDEITCPLLQQIFTTIRQMLLRMIPEHLPGGKYWMPTDKLREQTSSLKKHNKIPEFVFGLLDHLISFRPNASILANEAFIMYSYNKTAVWLHGLPEEEREKLLEESRKEGREIRDKFKIRLKEIRVQRLEVQKRRKLEIERLEKVRIEKEENLTTDICYYGLWQTNTQIEEGISACHGNANNIIQALKAQLRFRKTVLKQKHEDKKVYNFSVKLDSAKYKQLDARELKDNLCKLVKSATQVPTEEQTVGGRPLLVDKIIDHKFTDCTYRGKVISVVPGFPTWYNVIYDGDEAIYAYNLISDYEKGDVHIVVE